MRSLAATINSVAIIGQSNLAINSAQIEENRSLLEVNVLLRSLLLRFEGVEPDEGEGVDVVRVGGDWESRFYEAEGFEVGLEEVAARREGGIGVALDVGTELF